jgi:hypothetical protein
MGYAAVREDRLLTLSRGRVLGVSGPELLLVVLPPSASPPAPLRGALAPGWATPNPKTTRGRAFSRIAPLRWKGVLIAIQTNSRIPSFAFMCVLGPLFFRSLYQLVLTRSRCPQLPKANHFLVHLAFGPSGRPRGPLRPSKCAKFAGAGVPPPPHCAQPEGSPKKSSARAEDRGQPQSKQDAPHKSKTRKKLHAHAAIPCVLDWAGFSVVASAPFVPPPLVPHPASHASYPSLN